MNTYNIFARKIIGKYLIFIHMEEVQERLLWLANKNYLVPNQDWFRSHTERVTLADNKVHLLCKTLDAIRAFSDMKDRVHYLGFTSLDRCEGRIEKDFTKFLHLAGKSEKKGTFSVIDAWKNHPEWPQLTLQTSVKSHISVAKNVSNIRLITDTLKGNDLLDLMNSYGVHICVSEMEGFGHYIVEALSTGAVVLCTNGAPMNELVTSDCGILVDCTETYTQYRAKGFALNPIDFERAIESIIGMSDEELLTMSTNSRNRYLELSLKFEENVKKYFDKNILLRR